MYIDTYYAYTHRYIHTYIYIYRVYPNVCNSHLKGFVCGTPSKSITPQIALFWKQAIRMLCGLFPMSY